MKTTTRNLLLVSMMAAAMSCNSVQQRQAFASYDDYPVYQGEWEEMAYSPASTRFLLWAPTAQEVRVMLYEEGLGGSAYRMVPMEAGTAGTWTASVEGDLKGKFYAFNVKVNEVWQGDTPGIWAKAVGVNGDRAAVISLDDTDPEGWDQDRRPALKGFADIVLYEMHHRDFSIDSTARFRYPGKFLALTEQGVKTPAGDKLGIDHLKELGVTHVHLLPSFDYSSVDETRLDEPQYNWGYDPKNYNVPDGSYATDPYRPDVRIREFKQMVMALHQAGIRVVMDVVYNHTSVAKGSNFERTVPGYFYRQNEKGEFADASGCSNETASERAMMRRFMVESVCYWAKEYHVDGFRFDLMGIHDIETMNAIRKALDEIDPTIYMYGEGWAAAAPQLPAERLAMKNNTYKMPGVAAFSDEFRDSLRGPFADDKAGAFIIGRPRHEAGIRFGIAGGVEHPQVNAAGHSVPCFWAAQPTQFISYVSCHDDLCLADRLKVTLPGASVQEISALQKLTETAVLTSQGVPFLFAGDEVLRDKQGVHNSYNSPDNINTIRWNQKTEHRDVFDYVAGLIAMRKAHPAFRMGDADLIRKHLEFLPVPAAGNVVAFRLNGTPCGDSWLNTTVVLNARTEPVTVEVPEGKYWVAARDGRIDLVKGLGTFTGSQLVVGPRSAMIVHQ